MNDYEILRVNCKPCSEDITDLLADALAEIGFESFVADAEGLTAYIPAEDFDFNEAEKVVAELPFEIEAVMDHHLEEGRDWNEEWEKNYFKPIIIDSRCSVRSSFHPEQNTELEIIIDPRMAFGTGHHATTSQMMRYILDTPIEGKKVIDIGAGTGILSILCSKLGADNVVGIEIDPGAADNARENVKLNDATVDIVNGDASFLAQLAPADIMLANINRNVILADLGRYAENILPGGQLLLSGFYSEDIPLVKRACESRGLRLEEIKLEDNWAALRFRRS